jgi:hypothetical protein
MAGSTPLRFSIVVQPCTSHEGRFRWEVQCGSDAAVLSPKSYLSEGEAIRAAAEEMARMNIKRSIDVASASALPGLFLRPPIHQMLLAQSLELPRASHHRLVRDQLGSSIRQEGLWREIRAAW